MEKNNEESPLKIVHKSEEKKSDGQKPLSFDELMAKLSTLETVQEREQAVVENLRRKGL
jgi:hypothetical protein